MKDIRVWIAAVAIAVAAWSVSPFVFPPRAPAVEEELVPRIRYVCRKSGEVFVLPVAGDVVDNPKTGAPTLVPAVYDARRRTWRPGPPLQVMHRKGLLRGADE